MISVRKPTPERIHEFLRKQQQLELTYKAVGETFGTPPHGYMLDHTRVKLGTGSKTFEAAKAALRRWDQFRLGWLEAEPDGTPIKMDQTVAILAHLIGLWWWNACKIVAVVDENDDGPVSRFGFAYGTLPNHAGTGEERFMIEWDRSTDNVWYDILAFSQPHHLLARIGYLFLRATQKRFGRESSAAMLRVIRDAENLQSGSASNTNAHAAKRHI